MAESYFARASAGGGQVSCPVSCPVSTDYLKLWSESDLIRAIDYQLARQTVEWESRYGSTSAQDQQALLLTACAVSYVLGRGQVCLELSAWPKALAVSPEHLPTTDQLMR